MGRLLEKAASAEVINEAWKKFRNDDAAWESGISRAEMENNMGYHLVKLANELGSNTYIPNPVRFFPKEKANGKQRIISALTLRDKIAQRAVLTVIEPIGEKIFHPDSFGYRPIRNLDMAIAKVREYAMCGMEWVLDADIKGCFDNIPHKPMIKILENLIPDKEVVALIKRWLDVGAVRRGFLSAAKGIPQGSVLSPFLCNLYLTSWDNDMSANNLCFVRWADDFMVLCKSKPDAEKAMEFAEKTLNRLGLNMNMEKTRVTNCGPHVCFLGKKLPLLKKPGFLKKK